MKNQGIHLSWISVKNLQEAIQFYTEVVGLTVQEQSPEYGWAELSGPSGCILGIAQDCDQSDVKPGSNAVVTVTVDDLDKACLLFKQKGAQLVGDVMEVPNHVKIQTFKDHDGNTLQLVQKL
jgi:predicted enzyme related to lactoylglutathione lyase